MSEQQGSGSPQDRYYDRYLADTGPNKPSGGNKRLVIGAGIAAVVVAIAGVSAFALTRGKSTTSGSPASSTTTSSSGTGTESASTSTSSSPTTTPTSVTLANDYGAPTQPGWVTVAGSQRSKAAYDIPATEKYSPGKVDTLMGFEAPSGVDRKMVVATSPSTYDKGYCKDYKFGQRAFVGFVNIGTREPAEAAPSVASNAADLIALKKDKKTMAARTPTKTTTIKVGGGKITAVQSVLTVDNGDVDPKHCDTAKTQIYTVAFSNSTNGVSTMLWLVRDLGAGQMPDADVDKIIASLRPKLR